MAARYLICFYILFVFYTSSSEAFFGSVSTKTPKSGLTSNIGGKNQIQQGGSGKGMQIKGIDTGNNVGRSITGGNSNGKTNLFSGGGLNFLPKPQSSPSSNNRGGLFGPPNGVNPKFGNISGSNNNKNGILGIKTPQIKIGKESNVNDSDEENGSYTYEYGDSYEYTDEKNDSKGTDDKEKPVSGSYEYEDSENYTYEGSDYTYEESDQTEDKPQSSDANSKKKPATPIDLYYFPASARCRNVLLAAKAAGVDLNLKVIDLKKGDQLKPEFIKINPQHTVPTLDDNGLILTESRAIMTYLANQYAKDDQYYPKDPKKRAVVDQRLYFDMGTLFQRFDDLYTPMMFGGASFNEEKKKKLDEALGFLDVFLTKSPWVAGDNITLADLAIVSSVSTIEAVGHDISSYKNVVAWYDKAKAAIPGYKEANEAGANAFKQLYQELTKT